METTTAPVKKDVSRHSGSGLYGLATIGVLIYYISQASGFSAVMLAILKAILWPAFLIYELLRYIGA